jgi:alanyl-tRNA synthetase
VGDDTHLTFFEMLGNWSLGDYWKDDAIKWSFEFLTKELNIPLDRLAVSCFAGDEDAPKDEESAKIWENLGVQKQRIAFLPKKDNWWGPAGKTGPCGPDTEMFYWKLDTPAPRVFNANDKNWVEIWNDVFMQYVKTEDGKFVEAKQKNVDTGMGLERTLAVLNGAENVYHTDVFEKPHRKLHEFLKIENPVSERIILDHLRSAIFILSEHIEPSNIGAGYVLRRLIRRAIRYGRQIGIEGHFCTKIAEEVVETMGDVYPEVKEYKDYIFAELDKEESKFEKTLIAGLKILSQEIKAQTVGPKGELGEAHNLEIINGFPNFTPGYLTGKWLFDFYQTFGFPMELSLEEIKKGLEREIDPVTLERVQKEFNDEFKKHQELSRTASAGMFKGGLADSSEATTKLHTAAHLMLAGLRKVLGDDVYQKGSNITTERLRFDFTYPEKVNSGQLKDVENFVNGIIEKDLPVWFEEMPIEKAREINAMGVFGSKYGEKVKVYFVGKGEENVSKEICGGPHVDRTGIMGHFRITKEESSSSGVRRIKAILE